jgi:NAD(P)-dependent dehydrogenase (short-subunit alcohol dehydrogenase family)
VNRAGVTPDEARRRLAGMSPQQRLIQPEEIARLVGFLVSEEAAGINGQAINIDGGAVTA